MTDLEVYLQRLKIRLRVPEIPPYYFRIAGSPYISTPGGRIIRPSLNRSRWNTGL